MVTVCELEAVQDVPVQEPPPAMVKVVAEVTSPMEWPPASKPVAV